MKFEDIKTLLDAIRDTLNCIDCPCVGKCHEKDCMVAVVEHIYGGDNE